MVRRRDMEFGKTIMKDIKGSGIKGSGRDKELFL